MQLAAVCACAAQQATAPRKAAASRSRRRRQARRRLASPSTAGPSLRCAQATRAGRRELLSVNRIFGPRRVLQPELKRMHKEPDASRRFAAPIGRLVGVRSRQRRR